MCPWLPDDIGGVNDNGRVDPLQEGVEDVPDGMVVVLVVALVDGRMRIDGMRIDGMMMSRCWPIGRLIN